MRKIREGLRLRDEHGASQRQIVAACRLPRSTVRDYLGRLKAAGLTHAAVAAWTDAELEARLFARSQRPVRRSEPDWPSIARELGRRGVTLELLWREYLGHTPEGYRYTQFVARFRAWQGAHKAPRLRREHRPGEAVEIDYAGMTLTVGVGDAARPAQVFVAVLPYSGLVFADVTWTQQSADWLGSHVRLFEALGGVPGRLVPDNPKVGVSHASFYDPAINADYLAFARHDGTAVIPTRVRKPRDKASVENGVLQVERRVLAVLRDRVFADLAKARAAVRAQVDAFNAAPLRALADTSRQALFAEIERGTLKALPSAAFVIGTWSRCKVRDHYHVAVDGVAYSVPHRLIGATVDIHVGATGTGKTWLACALGHQAAREGYGVQYTRLTRLLDELATARACGKFARELRRLARLDPLIIDDWGMTELTAAQRHDLMEVIDDRHDRRATLLASQVLIDHWHRVIGDATYADAILDRLVHRAERIELTGSSLRKRPNRVEPEAAA